jgi:hypothetical protein
VWAIAALAEGLGIRAVARVFEVDPNTVLGWLVEAANTWRPSRAITCMISTSSRCRWTNCSPYSVPSRRERSPRRRPSSVCRDPLTGCGWRWNSYQNLLITVLIDPL